MTQIAFVDDNKSFGHANKMIKLLIRPMSSRVGNFTVELSLLF